MDPSIATGTATPENMQEIGLFVSLNFSWRHFKLSRLSLGMKIESILTLILLASTMIRGSPANCQYIPKSWLNMLAALSE